MVDSFLDNIARNSRNSKNTYQTGLTHFSDFLKGFNPISNTNLTLDTKIPALMDRNVDVYELLDQFVSYLSQLSIAVASVKLYISS